FKCPRIPPAHRLTEQPHTHHIAVPAHLNQKRAPPRHRGRDDHDLSHIHPVHTGHDCALFSHSTVQSHQYYTLSNQREQRHPTTPRPTSPTDPHARVRLIRDGVALSIPSVSPQNPSDHDLAPRNPADPNVSARVRRLHHRGVRAVADRQLHMPGT